ncbi:MAG: PilZ domain-containing protein [Alteromonadaceae bacterium]|nr:PilZ domain-containing protein [Alteromonadaceae bacterium]|tara:strand:+ start:3940 stop:4323 length:384 start_codon:yes stop_codon:yes gene_type:complete
MTNQERRRFHRVLFDAPCEIHQSENVWDSQVLDISLKGVLVRRPDHWDGDVEAPLEVVINLENGAAIVMAVLLKHVERVQLGFLCQYIDLESASHLRRLVELNIGNDELLQRDLAELGAEPGSEPND